MWGLSFQLADTVYWWSTGEVWSESPLDAQLWPTKNSAATFFRRNCKYLWDRADVVHKRENGDPHIISPREFTTGM